MRLILTIVLGWAMLTLPAAADYHDDGGDDGSYDADYDGGGAYDDDGFYDESYDDAPFDDPQVGAVQVYGCDQTGQAQCEPFETEGQGIRK